MEEPSLPKDDTNLDKKTKLVMDEIQKQCPSMLDAQFEPMTFAISLFNSENRKEKQKELLSIKEQLDDLTKIVVRSRPEPLQKYLHEFFLLSSGFEELSENLKTLDGGLTSLHESLEIEWDKISDIWKKAVSMHNSEKFLSRMSKSRKYVLSSSNLLKEGKLTEAAELLVFARDLIKTNEFSHLEIVKEIVLQIDETQNSLVDKILVDMRKLIYKVPCGDENDSELLQSSDNCPREQFKIMISSLNAISNLEKALRNISENMYFDLRKVEGNVTNIFFKKFKHQEISIQLGKKYKHSILPQKDTDFLFEFLGMLHEHFIYALKSHKTLLEETEPLLESIYTLKDVGSNIIKIEMQVIQTLLDGEKDALNLGKINTVDNPRSFMSCDSFITQSKSVNDLYFESISNFLWLCKDKMRIKFKNYTAIPFEEFIGEKLDRSSTMETDLEEEILEDFKVNLLNTLSTPINSITLYESLKKFSLEMCSISGEEGSTNNLMQFLDSYILNHVPDFVRDNIETAIKNAFEPIYFNLHPIKMYNPIRSNHYRLDEYVDRTCEIFRSVVFDIISYTRGNNRAYMNNIIESMALNCLNVLRSCIHEYGSENVFLMMNIMEDRNMTNCLNKYLSNDRNSSEKSYNNLGFLAQELPTIVKNIDFKTENLGDIVLQPYVLEALFYIRRHTMKLLSHIKYLDDYISDDASPSKYEAINNFLCLKDLENILGKDDSIMRNIIKDLSFLSIQCFMQIRVFIELSVEYYINVHHERKCADINLPEPSVFRLNSCLSTLGRVIAQDEKIASDIKILINKLDATLSNQFYKKCMTAGGMSKNDCQILSRNVASVYQTILSFTSSENLKQLGKLFSHIDKWNLDDEEFALYESSLNDENSKKVLEILKHIRMCFKSYSAYHPNILSGSGNMRELMTI